MSSYEWKILKYDVKQTKLLKLNFIYLSVAAISKVWQCLGDMPSTHDRQYNPAKIDNKSLAHQTNHNDLIINLIEVCCKLDLGIGNKDQ